MESISLSVRAGCVAFVGTGAGARQFVDRAGLETNRNVLAEVCEAAIGAVFVANSYDATAKAVIEALDERITYAAEAFVDHKTELQELLARQGSTVSYALVEATGPAHRRPRLRCRCG